MKKKILSCVLALALVGSAFGVLPESADFDTAITASAEEYGDFEYTVLFDGTVKITGYTGSSESVTIPSAIAGKKVTSIGQGVFQWQKSLKSVTIPNGVTSIDDYAIIILRELNHLS